MDPLTHALAGAAIASAVAGRQAGRASLLLGAVAGLLPDVDYLIRSAADPLLAIEHHRGFTHSLLISPIGGSLAALPFIATDRGNARRLALAGTLAWLSHVLLDAATTYGTQLFWPFSRYRVGLDIISILDPLLTLILLTGVVAAFYGRRRFLQATLGIAILWLTVGAVQRERAISAQIELATARRDSRSRGAVFPTVGNTIVWRSIYETGGTLRLDRIRVPWFGSAAYAEMDAVRRATEAGVAAEGARRERLLRDFERFAWFSDGWVALDPTDRTVIGDARYSLSTEAYEPIWGIRFHPGNDPPTEWVNRTRERNVTLTELWDDLIGRNTRFLPIRAK